MFTWDGAFVLHAKDGARIPLKFLDDHMRMCMHMPSVFQKKEDQNFKIQRYKMD